MSNESTFYDIQHKEQREHPGIQLSTLRVKRGYSVEYVAQTLHLRGRVIELIELGEYHSLAGPVFVKGYLQAYAKLLGVAPEPFIAAYNELYPSDKKNEKTLWQAKKQSSKAERYIRWVTLTFAASVVAAVGFWWQNGQSNDSPTSIKSAKSTSAGNVAQSQDAPDIKAADLSAMNAILNPETSMSPMEESGG